MEVFAPDGEGAYPRNTVYHCMLGVSAMNNITLSVKGANDALILLSEETVDNITTNHFMEVVLGGWTNTQSKIRVGEWDSADNLVSTPSLLDENEFRNFWMSWDSSLSKVGNGFDIGQQEIMQASYPSTTNVHYLGGFGWDGNITFRVYLT